MTTPIKTEKPSLTLLPGGVATPRETAKVATPSKEGLSSSSASTASFSFADGARAFGEGIWRSSSVSALSALFIGADCDPRAKARGLAAAVLAAASELAGASRQV